MKPALLKIEDMPKIDGLQVPKDFYTVVTEPAPWLECANPRLLLRGPRSKRPDFYMLYVFVNLTRLTILLHSVSHTRSG